MISSTRSPGSMAVAVVVEASGFGNASRDITTSVTSDSASDVAIVAALPPDCSHPPASAVLCWRSVAASDGGTACAGPCACRRPSLQSSPRSRRRDDDSSPPFGVSGSTYRPGRKSVKVLPPPGVLSTRISPPRSRAISRLIERPRPVPPNLRLVVPSACWNASKMSCCLSFGDADARVRDGEGDDRVRLVENAARESLALLRLADGERDAALLGELEGVRQQVLDAPAAAAARRCRSIGGASAWMSTLNCSPFCCATASNVRLVNDSMSLIGTSIGFTSILPASTFDRSRMSLMRLSRSVPDE